MTRDEVIRIAIETGFAPSDPKPYTYAKLVDLLERFANAVEDKVKGDLL